MKSTHETPAGKSVLHSALIAIAAELEARLEAALEYSTHADRLVVCAAMGTLTSAVNDTLDAIQALIRTPEAVADAVAADRMDVLRDALAASLPPIAGGAPDDFEEVDPEFEADPASWPAWTDRHVWNTTEPTPLEVLALDVAEPERTDADWDAYYSLSLGLSEADHHAAHACV